ncbi:hypothetical protein PG996_000081 [Apiospora saccharicola]|uniref:Uncharacterized protein n=1 Tax=Apiospora saccharicola TaxID=335842 RepID=A0ABR1WCS0_9PEZI
MLTFKADESVFAPQIWPAASWARTLPGAFGATPSSTTWGFAANNELYRSFFDDLEDKGPEHLYIQEAVKITGYPSDDWDLVWGSATAYHNDTGTGGENSGDNDDTGGDGYDGGGNNSDAESDFEMGVYSDDGSFGDGSDSDDESIGDDRSSSVGGSDGE